MSELVDFIKRIAARHGVLIDEPAGPPTPQRPPPPPEDLREQRRIEARLAVMETIPEEFRWARLDSTDLPKRCARAAVDKVRKAEPHEITLLAGPSRAGKTSIGTALFVARLNEMAKPSGMWAAVERLMIEALREVALGKDPPGLARARAAGVLLLDDLGQEPDRDESRCLVYDLVSERHRLHRPTIVTTGLTRELIEKRYGSGMLERLSEEGRALVVTVKKPPKGKTNV